MINTETDKSWLKYYQTCVNEQLMLALPDPHHHAATELANAMHYAVMNGGKRLRPTLVYALGDDLNSPPSQLHPVAVALELMHCYTLVHDDLPAMDDDDLRRGKPACHKAFTEATAILAGNALQSLSFAVIANNTTISATTTALLIQKLADISGITGICGGQALDIDAENTPISLNELTTIYQLKTGALIDGALVMSAQASGITDPKTLQSLSRAAMQIGLAFQIKDDCLDLTASTDTLGKPAKTDLKKHKSTYPQLTCLAQAQQKSDDLYHEAINTLCELPFPTNRLQRVFSLMVNRQR